MPEQRRILLLIAIMAAVAIGVVATTLVVLYQAALTQQRDRLVEAAQSRARLIEAMVRHEEQVHTGDEFEAALSQVREAHEQFKGFGDTGEYTLARLEDGTMVFLLSHRHFDLNHPEPVPFDNGLAEPMRRALSGESGTVIGLDYRGVPVLAAHEPIELAGQGNLGIVAKIDLAEIRAPFVRAGVTAGLATAALVVVGTMLFLRITNPLLKRLEQDERRYRALFENMHSGFAYHRIVTDEGGTPIDYVFLEINEAFEAQTRLKGAEIIGKPVTEVLPDIRESDFDWIGTYGKVALTGEPTRFEHYYEEPLNRWYAVSAYCPAREHFAVIFDDVTDRKRAEEAIRRTAKLESLGILAGGVAHDFNNLLTTMRLETSLAQSHLPPENAAGKHLGRAMLAMKRASDLAGQMLAYSGRGQFHVAQVDLNQLVRESSDLLRSSLTSAIMFQLDLAPDLPSVKADPTQLEQVLMNLVINAAEACGDSGTVRVETGRESVSSAYTPGYAAGEPLAPGEYVCLQVIDDGAGIDSDDLRRIFDPFFSSKATGRGLGLSSVLGIVRGHQGDIQVASEVGGGSRFKVLLPVSVALHR